MADNEVITVRRVYLRDPNIATTSMHHTIYAGAAAAEPGKPQQMDRIEFIGGVARDVPQATYERMRSLGHVTDQRPKSKWELMEEREAQLDEEARRQASR